MKTAKEIYPTYWEEEQKDGSFYGPGDYQPIINEIGNIIIQVDDSYYQGDSRILFEKDGKHGYLIFGWGSCSGCDELQGCSTISSVQGVIDRMVDDVKWFDSIDELKLHFKSKDWELDYAWHQDETKRFIHDVLNYDPS